MLAVPLPYTTTATLITFTVIPSESEGSPGDGPHCTVAALVLRTSL